MTVFSGEARDAVVARAGGCCEYCHLPTRGQVATFPIDHVLPRSSGGETILDNLALACPHCNAHKWAHTTALDPLSGASVHLFNPRRQMWLDHFQWSSQELGLLEGKTPCGRATIVQLHINDPDMAAIRQLLATLGLFAEIQTAHN
ncbi:MAG: HNH endonuclease [Gemmataceae bacterium]